MLLAGVCAAVKLVVRDSAAATKKVFGFNVTFGHRSHNDATLSRIILKTLYSKNFLREFSLPFLRLKKDLFFSKT